MFKSAGELSKLIDRGILIPSDDFDVEKLPDGRHKVHLRKSLAILLGACCIGEDCSLMTEADCLTAGGTFVGVGTLCDPNPCTAGACCIAGVCSILTEDNCLTAGGTFQGLGTLCDPNPCNPCDFEATLVCDSISASKSKCGFLTCQCDGVARELGDLGDYGGVCDSTERQYWFTKNHINTPTSDCPPAENCLIFDSGFCVHPPWLCVYNYFPGTRSQDYTASETYTGDDCDGPDEETESVTINTYCGCQDTNGIGGDPICPDPSTINIRCPADCQTPAPPYASDCTTVDTTYTYSDEFTTDHLKSITAAALPAYDDDFNDTCEASRDLADDESSYTIQRFRYKFTFAAAPAACDLCWIERFTPDEGDAVDTWHCEAITPGMTETSIHEVLEPASNGAVAIIY
jgi:hypothetical protein